MILTIAPGVMPLALIPISSVAFFLGVSVEQAAAWCDSGQLHGTRHEGHWWVSSFDLTQFVQDAKWQLVEPPSPPRPVLARGRRRGRSPGPG